MKAHENPLVNNKKLRQMYVAMVGARVLDEYVAASKGKRKKAVQLDSTRGEEACRVSTAIELIEGDLVSDIAGGRGDGLCGRSDGRFPAAAHVGASIEGRGAEGEVCPVRRARRRCRG